VSRDNSISRRELLCKATADAVAVGASVGLQPISAFAVPATSKQNSNAADVHLDGTGDQTSFIKNLLPAAVEKKMGIIGLKVPTLANIFRPNGIATIDKARNYVLTLPMSIVIIGIKSAAEQEENVHIAHSFKPFAPEEVLA
jgi:aryl-alcohol dehydrogenase-like predicted oxidoreductase